MKTLAAILCSLCCLLLKSSGSVLPDTDRIIPMQCPPMSSWWLEGSDDFKYWQEVDFTVIGNDWRVSTNATPFHFFRVGGISAPGVTLNPSTP